jgi:T5SS/PEP-CTERM-associated repeat protein
MIAAHPRSTGIVTVNGEGSEWTSSQGLIIGGNTGSAGGNGQLYIQNHGRVRLGSALSSPLDVGLKVWNNGRVYLDLHFWRSEVG